MVTTWRSLRKHGLHLTIAGVVASSAQACAARHGDDGAARGVSQADTSDGGDDGSAPCGMVLGDYCPVGENEYVADTGDGGYDCRSFASDLCLCMRGASGLAPMDNWNIYVNCGVGKHDALITHENPMCLGSPDRFCVVEPQWVVPGSNGALYCWTGAEPQEIGDVPVAARQAICAAVGGTYVGDSTYDMVGVKNSCHATTPVCPLPE